MIFLISSMQFKIVCTVVFKLAILSFAIFQLNGFDLSPIFLLSLFHPYRFQMTWLTLSRLFFGRKRFEKMLNHGNESQRGVTYKIRPILSLSPLMNKSRKQTRKKLIWFLLQYFPIIRAVYFQQLYSEL
jgi:hypothetical protein